MFRRVVLGPVGFGSGAADRIVYNDGMGGRIFSIRALVWASLFWRGVFDFYRGRKKPEKSGLLETKGLG